MEAARRVGLHRPIADADSCSLDGSSHAVGDNALSCEHAVASCGQEPNQKEIFASHGSPPNDLPFSWQARRRVGLSILYDLPAAGLPAATALWRPTVIVVRGPKVMLRLVFPAGPQAGHCSRCRRSQPEGILPGLLFDIVTALSGCAKSPDCRSDRDTACDQPAPEHFGTKGFVVRARQRINSCKGDEGAGNAGSHDIYDGRYPCLGTICHRFKWILAPVSGRRWTFHEHERATDLSRTDCADQEHASYSHNI